MSAVTTAIQVMIVARSQNLRLVSSRVMAEPPIGEAGGGTWVSLEPEKASS